MANELQGKKIAILAAVEQVEQVELEKPKQAVEAAGATTELLSLETGEIQAMHHEPWTLVEADLVRGRTLTSFPSIRTDIVNAGGTWVDEEVHVDEGLVTSRNPDDLPAFCAKVVEELAEGAHDVANAGATAGAA